jgi:hypothetical protein
MSLDSQPKNQLNMNYLLASTDQLEGNARRDSAAETP